MHLLGCLFFIVFGILITLFVVAFNVLKVFFRLKKATQQFTKGKNKAEKPSSSHSQGGTHTASTPHSSGKIFKKEEGEYVDFEEIK